MKQITFTLAELASRLNATYTGDGARTFSGIAPLSTAGSAEISFFDNVRYRKDLLTTEAGVVIIAKSKADLYSGDKLLVDNPYFAYAIVATLFAPDKRSAPGIHATAVIGANTEIAATASIGAHVVIGDNCQIAEDAIISAGCVLGDNCQIGANTKLYPNISLYDGVQIGQDCILHSGVVIGSDGFGFAKAEGQWQKVPQLGTVVIGNRVEIGANTTIDRGALGNTIIADDVKLDNQIQIAHNVQIGERTAMAGCSAVAGSTQIGADCLIGGLCGISGHIKLTDNVALTAMTGVGSPIHKPGVYSSAAPLQSNEKWRKNTVRIRHLDDIARRLHKLEKSLIGDAVLSSHEDEA